MSANVFVGSPDAKHLGRRSAYEAHGVEQGTNYQIEPEWENGRVVYTASFKPRESSSWVVPVEGVTRGGVRGLGKHYVTLDAARAACARHAQAEGLKIYKDRYPIFARAHAEDNARVRERSSR